MITMDMAEKLIQASRPPRGLHGSRMVLLGIGLLLGATLARPEILGQLGLPGWVWAHLVLLIVLFLMLWVGLRQRAQGQLMLSAFEGLQLQEWDKARDSLMRLLTRPVRHASARAEALIGLGSLAEIGHSYEVAQRIYESILSEAAANPVQLVMARMALSATLLRTGQTTDAVEMIDRLGRTSLPNSMKAHVELVTLFREVVMGQAADTIDKADYRRGLFREHLGTRAAYGYALLAAAYDRAGQSEVARQYWHDATLLIHARTLVERFRELAPLAARYPATEHPW